MNVRFIRSSEKKEIIENLKEQFGIETLPYLLFETGKGKIRGFSGSLSKDEILELSRVAHIEIIGSYLIRQEHDLRLSFDASQILSNQISKNILEINKDQFDLWIRGHDLEIKYPKGTIVIKYQNDLIGCGKSNGDKILNHIPKERRLRK